MPEASPPFVSVIIPVYNDAVRLALCLEALSKQSYARDCFEVIVIDNGSHQSPSAVVDKHDFTQLEVETKPGSYAARNKGLTVARGPVLAFTDADCIARPDWLKCGVERLMQLDGRGVVAGRIELFCRDPQRPTWVELYDCVTGLDQATTVVRSHGAATGNSFTGRQVFDAVGPFDETMKSWGDVQWAQRAHAAGFELVYCADAVIDHPARYRWGEIIRKNRRLIGGEQTLNKDKPKPAGRKALPLRLWNNLRPHLGEAWRRTDDERVRGFRQRLKVAAVITVLRYVKLYERIRLRLGGQTERL